MSWKKEGADKWVRESDNYFIQDVGGAGSRMRYQGFKANGDPLKYEAGLPGTFRGYYWSKLSMAKANMDARFGHGKNPNSPASKKKLKEILATNRKQAKYARKSYRKKSKALVSVTTRVAKKKTKKATGKTSNKKTARRAKKVTKAVRDHKEARKNIPEVEVISIAGKQYALVPLEKFQ